MHITYRHRADYLTATPLRYSRVSQSFFDASGALSIYAPHARRAPI